MAINNSFNTTWVMNGVFPWLSLEKTNEIKEKSKQMSNNPYEQSLIQDDLYKYELNKKTHTDFMKNRQNARMEMNLRKTQAVNDPKTKNIMDSTDKMGALADMFREYWYMHGKNWDDMEDEELVSRFTTKNPSVKKYSDAFLTWGTDSEYKLAQELWIVKPIWTNKKKEDSWGWDTLETIAEIGWWIVGADVGLYLAWRWLEEWWKAIYEAPIDSSTQEAKRINQVWTKIKDAEAEVKTAKKDLKAAKIMWEWVEEAEKAVETAEKNLKTAKWKKVVKVADTAREYNVWGGILEWWTAESRGIQASSKANQIFKQTIEPALEKSTAKINVQKLIEWLAEDIKDIAKNDPDKLKAYNDALADLKKSYKAKEFANYSMKDAQTLKSWLQGRTPQKFYKGKEITNELQELKGMLWSKLTNAIHKNLTNELWESSAKLYKDYANLKEYAWNMVKQSTNAWLKGWFWNFWSTTFHKLTDGASAKAWLLLNKTGEWARKISWVDKAVDSIWDAWNYVLKNWKKFLKASKWGWLRVEDPVGMVQLLRLVPWTIWEAADAAAESPAVAVDDLLFEVQDFKDTWNNMSDEERIQNIKDQFKQAYGSELNDESAIKTYEKRKEKHPKGKYWLLDPINDVEIVMRA